jgi:uncharacterized repeat protein (TIGR02543 family)
MWDTATPKRPQNFTVKVSKITFTKAVRYTLTFNANHDDAEVIAPVEILENTAVGDLPLPAARVGFVFAGWHDEDENLISASTLATENLNLKAKWSEKQTLAPFVVDFDTATLTPVGPGTTVVSINSGAGYEFTYGSTNYQGSWARITITLPAGVNLYDYDNITFSIKGTAGDASYKNNIAFLAGTPLPASYNGDPTTGTGAPERMTSVHNYSAGLNTTQTPTLALNKGRIAGLKPGVPIEITIWDQSNNAGTGVNNVPTKWEIWDMSFTQTP